MDSLLNPNMDDMDMEMDLDIDTDNNSKMNDKLQNQNITSNNSIHSSSSTSSSTVVPSTSNNNLSKLSPKFKMPEPLKKIKKEINDNISSTSVPTMVKVKSEDDYDIVIPTSVLSKNNHNQKRSHNSLDNDNNVDTDDSEEICPPSPEHIMAASLFSSQFEKELSKTKKVLIYNLFNNIIIIYFYM